MNIKSIISSAVNNPKLMLGVGITAFVGAGVWACVKTLKLPTILDEQGEKQDEIIENHSEEELQLPEVKKQQVNVTLQTIGRISWNYTGPAILAAVGGYCVSRAVGLEHNNAVKYAAAYTGISKAYNAVLDRVEKKWGQAGLKYAKYGIEEREEEIEVTEMDEKGKTKTHKEIVKKDIAVDIDSNSPFRIVFDESTSLYREHGGSLISMRSELEAYQNNLNIEYNMGNPIYFNDIVRWCCGNDERWLSDLGQVAGYYKRDLSNKNAGDDRVDLRIGTFYGCNPDTGEDQLFIYIDPNIPGEICLDANKARPIRTGKKYISQV